MSEEPREPGGQDEPTAPIDPGTEGGAADGPRRRSFLPKKREAPDRPGRERGEKTERSKKKLFGGRREPADASTEPDASETGQVAPAGSPADQTGAESTSPNAPQESAAAPVPAKARRRSLLPRRRSQEAGEGSPTDAAAGASDSGAEPSKRARRAKKPRPARKGRPPRQRRARREDRPTPASTLRRERRALLASRQEAEFHLGGLAFELYRRDLLQDGIIRQRAVELAALDDRIREIDRQLGERTPRSRRGARPPAVVQGPAGNCLVCRADFAPGARFCSSCGARFVPEAAESEQETRVIDVPTES